MITNQQLQNGTVPNANQEIFFSLATSRAIECYNCIVTYNTVHSNSHPEAINPAHGIFTAPESSNYFFQFHGVTARHKQAKLRVS